MLLLRATSHFPFSHPSNCCYNEGNKRSRWRHCFLVKHAAFGAILQFCCFSCSFLHVKVWFEIILQFLIAKTFFFFIFLQRFAKVSPNVTWKPKQYNSKTQTSLFITIGRNWVHAGKRSVFLLSSPPTLTHRNTFLETGLPKAFSSPLYLLQQNNAAGASSNTYGDTLLLLPALLDSIQLLYWKSDWTDHPPPSGWSFQTGREAEWVEDETGQCSAK